MEKGWSTPCLWCGGDVILAKDEVGAIVLRRLHSRCIKPYQEKHKFDAETSVNSDASQPAATHG